MKKTSVSSGCMFLILVLIISLTVQAQDRNRRVQPAFPIGAGEKMLIIPGHNFSGASGSGSLPVSRYKYNANSFGTSFFYHIELPVGTTLKRIVADIIDQSASLNFTISLVRIGLDDSTVALRTLDTNGAGTSSNMTDAIQLVGNPLSHAMMQGYAYYLVWTYPDGGNANDFGVGTVKVIYEP